MSRSDRIKSETGLSASVGLLPGLLVEIAKSARHEERKLRAVGRLASKAQAAKLLQTLNEKDGKRVSWCGYVAREFAVTLQANREAQRSRFDGLKTCGSVWWCPCCSPRIAAVRKTELDALLAGARSEGLSVVMLTLTFRHDLAGPLGPALSAVKDAFRRLGRRRDWQALFPKGPDGERIGGTVVATEVTHGRNGWHPHLHILMCLQGKPAEALASVEALREGWSVSLAAEGRSCNAAGFQVQGASAAGQYVAGFGAAEEMSLQGEKKGRKGGRSPWQLLDDARDGDSWAGRLWQEYALAFKGRRQLVWSRGLKARFGVDEVEDEAAAAETAPEPVTVRAWLGSGDPWRLARRRRAALLSAAAIGGDLDAAEFGQTDAALWRSQGGGNLIEGDG